MITQPQIAARLEFVLMASRQCNGGSKQWITQLTIAVVIAAPQLPAPAGTWLPLIKQHVGQAVADQLIEVLHLLGSGNIAATNEIVDRRHCHGRAHHAINDDVISGRAKQQTVARLVLQSQLVGVTGFGFQRFIGNAEKPTGVVAIFILLARKTTKVTQ